VGERTGIEWCDSTWNPWTGCTPVSAGCEHCYMAREQRRWGKDPWTVRRTAPKTFRAPLAWSPKRIFTCSWSDFFHPAADAWREEAWAIIRQTPQHRYLILTKRPERIGECLPLGWPFGYEHVWLGVTVEKQDTALRIDRARAQMALGRWLFVSAEPLLEPLDLTGYGDLIDWIIVAGESGPGARRMETEWAAAISDWAEKVGVPYFFKRYADKRDGWSAGEDHERREVPRELIVKEAKG
jgi:protein gp37